MKTFSVRIEEDLFNKVEAERGEKARTDFIREVIIGYFITKTSPELNQDSLNHIESLQSEILFLREQVKDLDRLLSQEQSLHLQTQKQIMPTPEEIHKKYCGNFGENYEGR